MSAFVHLYRYLAQSSIWVPGLEALDGILARGKDAYLKLRYWQPLGLSISWAASIGQCRQLNEAQKRFLSGVARVYQGPVHVPC